MEELKSVLIGESVHEKLKKFSKKTGLKIKSVVEQSIENFITEQVIIKKESEDV